MKRRTNSPVATAATLVLGVCAGFFGGWDAAGWATAGFLVGGIGTAVNAMRAGVR